MRKLTTLFVVSVAVNYVWEIAQAPLYVGMENYSFALLRYCFVASLGDGVMLLMIVVAGWIILQRQNWFERPGVPGYLVMLITGLILGVLVEWFALHVLGRWQYTARMPLVPGLGIGIVPIAQMLILPPLVFRTARFL
jgi:hypothetical protein